MNLTSTSSNPGSALARLGRPWVLGLVLVLVIGLVYAYSLQGEWIYDDHVDVLRAATQHPAWPLGNYFALGKHQRPLVQFSFALNFLMGRNNPFLYHCTSVGIHILAALSLYGLVRRTLLLGSPGERLRIPGILAFLAALLWGIHPYQAESVAYITQRYEALCGLFIFLTLYLVVRSHQSRRAGLWAGAAALSCLAALLSKEVAVGLPILVLLYDWIFLSESLPGLWRARRWLYVALVAVWALFLLNQLSIPKRGWAGFGISMPWWQYALNQPSVILHYLRLALWPHPMVFDYLWVPAKGLLPLLPGLLAIGALLAGTLFGLFKKSPWGFLGAFFFIILGPTSSFMPIQDLAVEHRMYAPLASVLVAVLVGLYLVYRAIIQRWPGLNRACRLAAIGLGAAVVATFGSLGFLRAGDFHSAITIWLDTTLKRPGNFRAHANLGQAYWAAGELSGGIRETREALALNPGNYYSRVNLGAMLLAYKKYDEARAELEMAVAIDPRDPKAWVNLAVVHSHMDEMSMAEASLRQALKVDPRFPEAHLELGHLFAKQGRPEEAVAEYREAARLRASFSLPHWCAGMTLLEQGDLPGAKDALEAYVRLEPQPAVALTKIGQLLYGQGRVPEAMEYWKRARVEDPGYLPASLALAWALATHPSAEYRNGSEALALVGELLREDPERIKTPAVLETRAASYAELGRFPEACRDLEEALSRLQAVNRLDLAGIKDRLAGYREGRVYRENPDRKDL